VERWAQSQNGLGQVVLLSGEAGIGKSRLVETLRQRLGSEGMTSIVLRCSPYYTNSALYSVIDHLQRLLHFHREDTPEERLDKLEHSLREYRFARDEVMPLFATLLSVPLPDGRYPPLHLSPQQQKRKTAEALIAWLVETAERQPLLAVWEDLHWADPSTIELLSLIIDQSRTARMLTLLTCRPEFQPSWSPRSHLTHLTLNRFTHPQVELLIAQAMDGKSLPPEVVQQVVAKTDGVPLFVEELLKMVVESGLVREEADRYVLNGPLPPLAIPATLQDSLMARLDRLAPVKDVAQLGAVLGRSFPYDVMQAVSSLDEEALQRGLAQLVDAELLYQRGHPPQAQYLFKHALIQDAAYQSLLKSTRQQYHLRIAQVLAAQFPETAETQPELLAQHYTEAGLAQQATKYWLRAGQRANERSAYVEAIAHCTKGLALHETLPETPERAQHELMLCLALGTPLVATKGHGAMDVERVFSRARALCAQGGSTAHRFQALAGLFVFYELRGALRIAHELTQELLTMAQHEPVTVFRPRACACGGQTFLYLGDLTSARTTFEQGMAVYDPRRHSPQVLGIWQDSGVTCLSFVALILWLQGYPDQAKATSHNALTLSEQLSHPFTTAFAAFQAASLHRLLRERPQVQEHVEMVRVLETTYGLTQFSAQSTMMQGWALATQGDATEGMAQLREGLDVHRAKGTELGLPSYLTMLAEVYLIQGRIDEGLTVVTEALALVDKNEERWWEAELHRLKGELLVSQVASRESEGEACLQQSLAVARRQEAKSLELRTAMSLARLWQQQGKRAEAHALLAPIYGWFTEGFDTADLQEAKALLEALT
jgi:predicted ATPase